MRRRLWLVGGAAVLVLVLAGGAFVAGRLVVAGQERADGGAGKTKIVLGKGPAIEAEFVPAEEHPGTDPDVAGAFAGRQDNSLFVNETEDGFVISKGDDGSFGVANATGRIHELVITAETEIYADVTLDSIDDSLVDGKLHQKLRAGTIEEIGELSWVRAWGEKRGDRLVASVLLYTLPPVISR